MPSYLERVHKNPSAAVLKNIAKNSSHENARIAIDKDNNLWAADGSNFLHQDLGPGKNYENMGNHQIVGYVTHHNGNYIIGAWDKGSQLTRPSSHPQLDRLYASGFENGTEDKSNFSKFANGGNVKIIKKSPTPAEYIEKGSMLHTHEHPETGAYISAVTRPTGRRSASITDLYVPEEHRNKGVAKALLNSMMQQFPSLQGQVSSKIAAKNAYAAGRRMAGNEEASLDDIYKKIDEDSSVNMWTPKADGGDVEGKSNPAKNFSKWFGRSKLVDKDGKPMVLFHGTDRDFSKFDPHKHGASDHGWYGVGHYLTADPSAASAYSAFRGSNKAISGEELHEGANVMPVHARLENPYIWPENRRAATSIEESIAITRQLMNMGYDGVIAPNYYDDGPYASHHEVVVFRPHQIKSATGNNGDYDPLNADITKADGGEVDDYRGQHPAPGPDGGVPLHDTSGVYPADFYGPRGFDYYANFGEDYDRKAYNTAVRLKGDPEAPVWIHRAVPTAIYKAAMKTDAPLAQLIKKGDWVTPTKEYARDHGEGALNGDYKIASKRVKAKEVFTNGDSIHEWGYHPFTEKADGGALTDDEGITAYHGSPHDFEQFDVSKIGTGEGAQAYGHGLYFAESEPVARGYRDRLSKPYYKIAYEDVEKKYGPDVVNAIESVGGDPDELKETVNRLRRQVQNNLQLIGVSDVSKLRPAYEGDLASTVIKSKNRADAIEKILNSGELELAGKGHMYEVHINAHPEKHFLDWDATLRDQPEAIRRLAGWNAEDDTAYRSWLKQDTDNLLAGLEGTGTYTPTKSPARPIGSLPMSMKGHELYEHLKNKLGAIDWPVDADADTRAKFRGAAAERVSQYLQDNGIRGIRYLDAGSRGDSDQPTRNYVVFNHDHVKVRRKYKRGGAV